jgi:purine-nucleoside phosphorylase
MSPMPLATADLEARVAEALAAVRSRSALIPAVALTLGSGLGAVAASWSDAISIPTAEIPHWPRSTVSGHAGALVLARRGDTDVVALSGRSHRYEGYSLDRVTFGVRVMHALGARTMIFTNAVGGIRESLTAGDLMLASDQLNFIGTRGLFTPDELRERRAGRRVASPHSPALAAALERASAAAGIRLQRGTLMGGLGPAYETAAEIRMAAVIGADAVCMSTVHEVALAAELGCECASLSCVTNRATGLGDATLSHDDVKRVADRVAESLERLIEEYLRERGEN